MSSSTGPSGTTFSHVATSKTGEAVQPTTETLTYYTVYRRTVTITKYVYKSRSEKSTGAGYGYYDGTTTAAKINLGTSSANGYTFRGWRTSSTPSGDLDALPNESITTISDKTYYATYKKTIYLYYNSNGGSNSISASSGSVNMSYTGSLDNTIIYLTSSKPSRSGYTFNGWYTLPSGGSYVNNYVTTKSDVVLYAHWTME